MAANNYVENSYHVVSGSGANDTAALDGFTIAGGNADGLDDDERGAGMYNEGGSFVVTNGTFTGTAAASVGGGLFNYSAGDPTLVNCAFTSNYAGTGGAMRNDRSSPILEDCTFNGNLALSRGGAISNVWTESSPALVDCYFRANTACQGGAISNEVLLPKSCSEKGPHEPETPKSPGVHVARASGSPSADPACGPPYP